MTGPAGFLGAGGDGSFAPVLSPEETQLLQLGWTRVGGSGPTAVWSLPPTYQHADGTVDNSGSANAADTSASKPPRQVTAPRTDTAYAILKSQNQPATPQSQLDNLTFGPNGTKMQWNPTTGKYDIPTNLPNTAGGGTTVVLPGQGAGGAQDTTLPGPLGQLGYRYSRVGEQPGIIGPDGRVVDPATLPTILEQAQNTPAVQQAGINSAIQAVADANQNLLSIWNTQQQAATAGDNRAAQLAQAQVQAAASAYQHALDQLPSFNQMALDQAKTVAGILSSGGDVVARISQMRGGSFAGISQADQINQLNQSLNASRAALDHQLAGGAPQNQAPQAPTIIAPPTLAPYPTQPSAGLPAAGAAGPAPASTLQDVPGGMPGMVSREVQAHVPGAPVLGIGSAAGSATGPTTPPQNQPVTPPLPPTPAFVPPVAEWKPWAPSESQTSDPSIHPGQTDQEAGASLVDAWNASHPSDPNGTVEGGAPSNSGDAYSSVQDSFDRGFASGGFTRAGKFLGNEQGAETFLNPTHAPIGILNHEQTMQAQNPGKGFATGTGMPVGPVADQQSAQPTSPMPVSNAQPVQNDSPPVVQPSTPAASGFSALAQTPDTTQQSLVGAANYAQSQAPGVNAVLNGAPVPAMQAMRNVTDPNDYLRTITSRQLAGLTTEEQAALGDITATKYNAPLGFLQNQAQTQYQVDHRPQGTFSRYFKGFVGAGGL